MKALILILVMISGLSVQAKDFDSTILTVEEIEKVLEEKVTDKEKQEYESCVKNDSHELNCEQEIFGDIYN